MPTITDERWYADFLQGLGIGTADSLQSWLATQRG